MRKLLLLFFSLLLMFCEAKAQQDTLHVLAWNIYMLPKLAPRPGRVARAKVIAQELSKQNIDIIVFEEAFHPRARKVIAEILNDIYPYRYGPANPRTAFKANSGVWMLSKIPLKVLGTIEYAVKNTFDAFTRKGAMLVEGDWKGHAFQLLGTHMQADNFPETRELQMIQFRDSLLLPFLREGVPQFIAGDLNVDRYHLPTYSSMLKILSAEDGIFPALPKYSWDGVVNPLARKIEKGTQQWLDYILVKKNGHSFALLDYQLFVLKKEWKKNFDCLSDHYGVLMNVVF